MPILNCYLYREIVYDRNCWYLSLIHRTANSLLQFQSQKTYNEMFFCFVFCSKIRSVHLEIIGWFFSPEPTIFSASDRPRVEFPRVSESPEKFKNLQLINLVRNRGSAKRKCHMSFFVCEFKNFKLVPINSELNSAPGNQTHFFLKSGGGT